MTQTPDDRDRGPTQSRMEERTRHKAILDDLTKEIEALKGGAAAATASAAIQRPGTASAELGQVR